MTSVIIGFDIGIKNLAYCIMEKNGDNKEIKYVEKIDLKCRKTDTQKIIDATIELLDDIYYNKLDLTADITVLIESQMTSIMRCIQTVINTYFKIQSRYQLLNIKTKYVSAKNKLNLIDKYKGEYDGNDKIMSNSYSQNKKDSIHFGRWLLAKKYYNKDIIDKIELETKKDDYYDAVLMTIYFIELLK
jgi:hypothetical protein